MAVDQVSETFVKFVKTNATLIVDTSGSSRVRLANTLSSLGAPSNMIHLASDFSDGMTQFQLRKPKLVLCDYMLGGVSGLDLLQERRRQDPKCKDSVFILVTGNMTQAAVARAAEEDVDSFILKPYTLDTLKKGLVAAVVNKLNPGPYIQTIELGKSALDQGELDEADRCFQAARELNEKPSLACFYLGQVKLIREALDLAGEDYKRGMQYNRIHFKCMVGLYEVLMARGRHREAYDVVRIMARFFPANPSRIASVVKLAVTTRNYDDVSEYYETFTAMDQRTEEAIASMCAGLCVAGKFHALKEEHEAALAYFDKASVSCAGRTRFLRYIIETLCAFKRATEAERYLKRFPSEARESADFLASQYRVATLHEPPTRLVYLGREILRKGVVDPDIYEILIGVLKEIGHDDEAEELMGIKAAQGETKLRLSENSIQVN